METDLKHFLREKTFFHVIGFPNKYATPAESRLTSIPEDICSPFEIVSAVFDVIADAKNFVRSNTYHCYTPEECYERAKACINNSNYSLISNNCEHFAIWCKTGISMSTQIDELLNTGSGGIRILRTIDLLGNSSQTKSRDVVEVYEIGHIKYDRVGKSVLFGLARTMPDEMELIHNPEVEWLFYVYKTQLSNGRLNSYKYSNSELVDINCKMHRQKKGYFTVKRLTYVDEE